jgi:2-polyprenyl-6-methoxyphenol hydroxylase-like FAD-dependent oxidoreductase
MVLIAGGGIGGLSLALSLQAAGPDDVEVFEAAATVEELGVGINVLPHAVGADGVHSAIRAQLYPDEGPPLWNGITVWRAPARAQPFLSGATVVIVGHFGKRVGAAQAVLDARTLARTLALEAGIEAALEAYEEIRRPATAAVVLANRQVGAEKCMELAEQRAPDGFRSVADVFGPGELEELSGKYKRTAGFDPAALNERPSLSVTHAVG